MNINIRKLVETLLSKVNSLKSTASAPQAEISPNSNTSCYFPRFGQQPEPVIADIMKNAEKSLDVAVYSLTDANIVKAVISAKKRGLAVRFITDRTEAQQETQKAVLDKIKEAGIPVKVNSHAGLMHLNVIAADGKFAMIGGFNFAHAAAKENDEIFVVLSSLEIVSAFVALFDRMWSDEINFIGLE